MGRPYDWAPTRAYNIYMPRSNYDPLKHHRRSIRLKGYDYSQVGAYYVTIVTWRRECLFGDVINGEMKLNLYGKLSKRSGWNYRSGWNL